MWTRAPIIAMAMLTLAACSIPVINREADTMAKGFYEAVRTGADVSNDPRLSPELRGPGATAEVARLRGRIVPEVAAQSIDNRSFHINTDASGTRVELTHAYHYADRVVVAETVMIKAPGAATFLITGFHVRIEGAPPPTSVNAAADQPPAPTPTGPPPTEGAAPAPDSGGAKP